MTHYEDHDWRLRRWLKKHGAPGDSRSLTRGEERRFGRKMAREYMHKAVRFTPCWQMNRRGWSCLTCYWRTLTGYRRKARADFISRANRIARGDDS